MNSTQRTSPLLARLAQLVARIAIASTLALVATFAVACRANAGEAKAPKSKASAKPTASAHSAAAAEAAKSLPRFAAGKTYHKPAASALKRVLTAQQYDVTQNNGTERPFSNAYWNNKKAGIYVDVVSGEPLFASVHKFKSGTGWPSFYRPLEPAHVIQKRDGSHFMVRVEVRSKHGKSHLGHLFNDGPRPTGLRYCINSASLRFVPKARLAAEGYAQYIKLFTGAK